MSNQANDRAERVQWCDRARHALKPGEKQPCAICGDHVAVTHAHHLAPVSLQYATGVQEPIQEFTWLCPTHHSLVHLAIDAAIQGKTLSDITEADKPAVLGIALQGLGALLSKTILEKQE